MLFDNIVFKLDILPNPTQMNKYITIINKRTYISLLIAIAVLFVSFTFEFSYDIDLTLLSIAIIFPLVFNIRGSFRRREKALEHLSQFRSSLKTLSYYFICAPGLTEEDKEEAARIKTHESKAGQLFTERCAKLDRFSREDYLLYEKESYSDGSSQTSCILYIPINRI